jgi:hypothetical protein
VSADLFRAEAARKGQAQKNTKTGARKTFAWYGKTAIVNQ